MVCHVKGCWQVQKSKPRNISIIQGEKKITDDFLGVQFQYCVRVGRQTESGCRDCWREVVRELRRNQFFNYLGDKGKVGDRTIVLQFILVNIFFFLRRGVARAVLKTSGKTPEVREELTRAVREGRGVSRHSTSRRVGIGSSWQVWGADFRMRFLTPDSETGLKVQSGMPSNGFVRGKELVYTGWESRSSLSLMILSQKKNSREQSWEIR